MTADIPKPPKRLHEDARLLVVTFERYDHEQKSKKLCLQMISLNLTKIQKVVFAND